MMGREGKPELITRCENCKAGRQEGRERRCEYILFFEECLFGFYGKHNSKKRKGSCRDVT